MSVLYDWSSNYWVEGSGITGYPATDGTYVWFIARNSAQTYMRLFRLRHSDKQLIKPDGTVGTYLNAYVDIAAGGYFNENVGCATDGTYVLVGGQTMGISAYRCSDMVQVLSHTATSYGGAGNGPGPSCWKPLYFNGYFWVTGLFPAPAIYRVTPGTWAVTNLGSGGVRYNMIWTDGTDLWLRNYQTATTPLAKFNTSGTKLFDIADSEGGSLTDAYYDASRGHMFFTGTAGYEHVRVRASDGAAIDAGGNVVATVPLAKVKSTYQNGVVSIGGGIAVVEDVVHVSGNGTIPQMQRRNLLNACANVGGQSQAAAIASNVVGYVSIGDTLYAATGNLAGQWNVAGLRWTQASVPVTPAPNITDVSLLAGQVIQITLDSAVTISGTAIGPPLEQLEITAVSQSAPAQIVLHYSVTPPNLIQVTPNNAGQGIEFAFDTNITASPPPTLDPPVNGLEVTSATAPDATHIQVGLQFPTLVSTTLVSIVASVGTITLTFNKAVALSLTGQQPSSYVITTVTPGAVIPTIASVEVVGNQVVLHTSEQTTGANYTVTIAPGSIYGTT